MKKLFISLTAALLLLISGCSPSQNNSDKPRVIASLFPQYDFVRQIAQDKVEVILLLPPGVESHAFEPTPSQIIQITQADLFIYTNAAMEPWIDKIVENIKDEKLLVLESAKGITYIDHDHDDHDDHDDLDDHDDYDDHDDHDDEDPHVWLDPINAKIMVNNILEALIQIDPVNKDFYTANAQDYLSKLDDLDLAYQEVFAFTDNDTIVYGGHFAFGYLAHRYNIQVLSPYTGFAPDSEPTANAIAQLIDTVNRLNIKIIFYEELIDPRVARVISEQTGTTAMLLHGAHNLTTKEMDEGLTYLDIMYENAEKLKAALSYEPVD